MPIALDSSMKLNKETQERLLRELDAVSFSLHRPIESRDVFFSLVILADVAPAVAQSLADGNDIQSTVCRLRLALHDLNLPETDPLLHLLTGVIEAITIIIELRDKAREDAEKEQETEPVVENEHKPDDRDRSLLPYVFGLSGWFAATLVFAFFVLI